MKKYIYLTCILLAMISCEIRFEPDIPKEDSKLFAFCLPGSTDSTAIIVDIARYEGDSIEFDWTKADVELLINGEREQIHYLSKYKSPFFPSPHYVPEKSFYITREILPGDEVTLEVSYPGLESISAATIVPEKPLDASFTIESGEIDEWNYSGGNLIIEYTDTSEDSYYAVVFRKNMRNFNSWGYVEENGEIISGSSETFSWEPLYLGYDYDPFQSENEYQYEKYHTYAGMVFWKNSHALDKDGRKMVYFSSTINHDVIYYDYELDKSYLDISYEATLYRINEELYRYYYTNFLADGNSLSYFGLSRNNATYTNIMGGFGILGGMSGHTMTTDVD